MKKKIIILAITVAAILMIPVIGMQVSDGWNWTAFDFVWATVVLFGSGLTYLFISERSPSTVYKTAAGMAVFTGLALIWINGAVGIIGDGPINLLYFAVIAIGFLGSIAARFKARQMSRVLFAMATVQMLVPIVALIVAENEVSATPGVLGVFVLNALFAMFFTGSGMLFQQASAPDLK